MKIESLAFGHNQKIPQKYTCDGKNINPPLKFFDVPSNSKSLAVIIDDPDAPAGTWVHWILYNLDPKTSEISENSTPPNALEAITSFGKPGYGGPCPPSGTHRYFFKLYALDATFDSPISSGSDLEKAMHGHVLDQAELVGLYARKIEN